MSENDNGKMAQLYNLLDRVANRLGCAFILIHHTSKGDQSGKSVTDVGAGAGSQSRATDAHLILRPHELESLFVLEGAVRSFPPLASRVATVAISPLVAERTDRAGCEVTGQQAKAATGR